MKKTTLGVILAFLMGLFFAPMFAHGQNTTTLTGIVTDSDSQAWVNAAWTATPVSSQPGGIKYTDGTAVPTLFSGNLDSTGAFTGSVGNVSNMVPQGVTLKWNVCSVTSASCSSFTTNAFAGPTGSTFNMGTYSSSRVTAPRIESGKVNYAYNTTELQNVKNGDGYTDTVSFIPYLYINGWVAFPLPANPTFTSVTTSIFNKIFWAWDTTSLSAALTSCSAYVTANHVAATVRITAGNYNWPSAGFVQPFIGGMGCNIIGDGNNTNVYMPVLASPITAMISRAGGVSGNQGTFTLSNFNLFCSDSAKTKVNANYGLQLLNIQHTNIYSMTVSNCGTSSAGVDIYIGHPGVGDEVTYDIQNVTTNYDENLYTAPNGGGGPTPPANGIDFAGGVGDSTARNLFLRNATNCGILVEPGIAPDAKTGGLRFDTLHAFGFASTTPQNYYANYAYCDESNFGGNQWFNAESDSAKIAGFYIDIRETGGTPPNNNTNVVQIVAPNFYWATPFSNYPGTPLLVSITAASAGAVDILDPMCVNKGYTSGLPYVTGGIVPSIYGGYGCGVTDNTGMANIYSPLNVEADSSTGNIMGSGANVDNFWLFSNSRARVGYKSGTGAVLQAGAGADALLCANATFGSGCMLAADPTTGIGIGGSNIFSPNQRLGLSGIQNAKTQTDITVSTTNATIAPAGENTRILGTGSIQTITPPTTDCTTSGYSCRLRLISVNGFSLTTGGNIATAATVPFGTSLFLTYLPTQAQWYPISAPSVLSSTYTVANLPGSGLPPGSEALVTDASSTTVGACVGGGAVSMIAVWNGSAWSCH